MNHDRRYHLVLAVWGGISGLLDSGIAPTVDAIKFSPLDHDTARLGAAAKLLPALSSSAQQAEKLRRAADGKWSALEIKEGVDEWPRGAKSGDEWRRATRAVLMKHGMQRITCTDPPVMISLSLAINVARSKACSSPISPVLTRRGSRYGGLL